ncbi:alpha/beta hydrolase [Pseudonocardia xishanensis]|uniref:Alpha/beta hydrolase n=1 Tax=Pseudonocardia xishanensis TaxID=630995 RepID=A0ABP8S235_9PSEU
MTVELPSDPQMQAVIGVFRQHLGEPMRELGAAEVRTRRAALRSSVPPAVELAEVRDIAVSGRSGEVPVRLYRPQDGPSAGVVVYLHGGGWVLGSLDESDTFCRVFAGITGCDVVSVEYRLAPEHTYPAAVEDADDAVRWIARELAGDAPLVLMGDSAGGTLAAAVAQHARADGSPQVALQVLVYPVLDHRMATPSYTERGGKLLISADDMDWFWSVYVPDVERRAEPDASPGLVEDLAGLAPALFVVAEFDPMRDEALDYARRLESAGVPTTVLHYDTVAHGFFPMAGTLAVADNAIRTVGLAVADACRAGGAVSRG